MDAPLKEISITIDQLPLEIAAPLTEYLKHTYPSSYVNISFSPLTIFGSLPIEILSLVVKAKAKEQVVALNQQTRDWNLPSFLQENCDRSVSRAEVIRYMREERATVSIICDDGTTFITYRESEDSNIGFTVDQINLIMSNNLFDITEEEGFDQEIDDANQIRKDFQLTILTEYRLLWRRDSCLLRDITYANKVLVARYNRDIAPNLSDPLKEEDIKKMFVVHYTAKPLYARDIENRGFSLTDLQDVAYITGVFQEDRETIRDHIVEITGAKTREEGSNYLTLG